MPRKIIGEGGYGCVHKPSIHCTNPPIPGFNYNNYVSKIMLTPDCFKELCMISQTDKAKGVRKYYIIVEGLLRDHFEEIINNLNE